MHVDTKILTKRYYTIAEVSEMFGVAKSLLRYWESEFKQIQPRKDRGGIRRYTAQDIDIINRIYELVKVKGFTIDGARKALVEDKRKKKISSSDIKTELETVLSKLKGIRSKL